MFCLSFSIGRFDILRGYINHSKNMSSEAEKERDNKNKQGRDKIASNTLKSKRNAGQLPNLVKRLNKYIKKIVDFFCSP